jgi:transcriptional regulatory protein LevR/MoxR-like ATPase
MKRIELVFKKVTELSKSSNGITASTVASALNIGRANASYDLNRLYDEHRLLKIKGKPVLYTLPLDSPVSTKNILDTFLEKNPSLFSSIEQAKAAILYPPHGMPLILLGKTGVGKSTFASLLYKYACEIKHFPSDAPFITFNCADYASNPQLLLSQLFGAKKGSYTGADANKIGLVEKANGGILFLDEVHRLPPEGQEMFFPLIDHGKFRRLGETDIEHHTNILLILATTETPDDSLLKTFLRRIPMIIHIPDLNNRSSEERFQIISDFLSNEAIALKITIKFSTNALRSFLYYDCPNNIGQLKADIKITCARAYVKFITMGENKEMLIRTSDLPKHIRTGLYNSNEHQSLWNNLIGQYKHYFIFKSDAQQTTYVPNFFSNKNSIYTLIDSHFHELKKKNINQERINKELQNDLNSYFDKYLNNIDETIPCTDLTTLINPNILRVIREVIGYYQKQLNHKFSQQITIGLILHIANSIERIKRNQQISNPNLNSIRTTYPNEFHIALESLKIIENALGFSIPIDEAGYLTIFLTFNSNELLHKHIKKVNIIIIAHGKHTASSIADTANRLLSVTHAIGIDVPLNKSVSEILSILKNFFQEPLHQNDTLFLVDMGSLTALGKELESLFSIHTKTIPLVSTLHAIEATRRATIGASLSEVYQDVLAVNTIMNELHSKITAKKYNKKIYYRPVIITICTTGKGGALFLKVFLEKNLSLTDNLVEIHPIAFQSEALLTQELAHIQQKQKILCIITPFELPSEFPQYHLNEILNKSLLPTIQKVIDQETLFQKISVSLDNHLKHLKSIDIIPHIRKMTEEIAKKTAFKISSSSLIGIVLHISCFLDRLKDGPFSTEIFSDKENFIMNDYLLYSLIKDTCTFFEKTFTVYISDDEICNIMSFYKQKS